MTSTNRKRKGKAAPAAAAASDSEDDDVEVAYEDFQKGCNSELSKLWNDVEKLKWKVFCMMEAHSLQFVCISLLN